MTTIASDLRRQLYYNMLLIRRVEERIQRQYHLREMRSPPHLYMGHEAVAVGVCAALRPGDWVLPYYRSHGWYLAKGGDLRAMMAELFGKANGCSRGWGGSMHLIDLDAGVYGTSAIVGGTIPHAAGIALSFRMRGMDAITAVSFGDGATEEGVFHETLNFASLRKLPMIFVCEDNFYATNTHIRDRQAQPEIWRRGGGYSVPGIEVDGNDVQQVYQEAATAVRRAREGEGPTLMVCRTYRFLEHCGINDDHDLGYRTLEEIQEWRTRDPLQSAKELISDPEVERMEEEISGRIDEAFAYARSSPFPASLVREGAVR
jgi:TPP-dependent pyruvate/acetoin dehydrogenase alpha subunit